MAKEQKDKKKFFDTGFGKFVKKAGAIVPDVLDVAADVVSGDISGAIDKVRGKIEEKAKTDQRAAELLHELQLKQMEFEKDIFEMEVRDRDSARNREIEIVKAGSKNTTQNALAFIGVFCFFGMVGYLLVSKRGLGDMSSEEAFIIGNCTGICGAIAKDIFAYFFGSSRSSRMKDEAMYNNQRTNK